MYSIIKRGYIINVQDDKGEIYFYSLYLYLYNYTVQNKNIIIINAD